MRHRLTGYLIYTVVYVTVGVALYNTINPPWWSAVPLALLVAVGAQTYYLRGRHGPP